MAHGERSQEQMNNLKDFTSRRMKGYPSATTFTKKLTHRKERAAHKKVERLAKKGIAE